LRIKLHDLFEFIFYKVIVVSAKHYSFELVIIKNIFLLNIILIKNIFMKTQCNTCNTLRNRGYKYGKNYCSKRVKDKWLNISLLFSTSFSPFFDTLRCGPTMSPPVFPVWTIFYTVLEKSKESKFQIDDTDKSIFSVLSPFNDFLDKKSPRFRLL